MLRNLSRNTCENRRRLHQKTPKRDYQHLLLATQNRCGQLIAFGRLDDKAVKVSRVLCMLAPDRIPWTGLSHEAVISSYLELLEDEGWMEKSMGGLIQNLQLLDLFNLKSRRYHSIPSRSSARKKKSYPNNAFSPSTRSACFPRARERLAGRNVYQSMYVAYFMTSSRGKK